MKIEKVKTTPTTADIKATIKIVFSVSGALPVPFQFPFSNESTTENKIEFTKEELYGNAT